MHFQKKFTEAEKKWLQRQKKDYFVKSAKKEGYRARSAYKLLEIEKKFRLLKSAKKIVDLGSAPGSWSQVAREKASQNTQIFAFDLLYMQDIAGVKFLQKDCFDLQDSIIKITEGNVDLILSDMAPNNCGDNVTDHFAIVELCERCLQFCQQILTINGNFVCKITHGKETNAFVNLCKTMFEKVSFFKPPASRKDSREIYIVAQKFLCNEDIFSSI